MEKESLIASLKERIGETDFNAISRRSVETIIEPMLPLFADDEKVTEETFACGDAQKFYWSESP